MDQLLVHYNELINSIPPTSVSMPVRLPGNAAHGFVLMEKPKSCETIFRSARLLEAGTVERLKQGDPAVLIPTAADIQPTPKLLTMDPKKCNGCGFCELACTLYHEREIDSARSRIRILSVEPETRFLPVYCQQCTDAPCRAACPREAISLQAEWERVVIDYDRCISCRMCVAACPFGAMGFDRARAVIFKCDMCDGNPQCVNFCEPGALMVQRADDLQYPRIREAACVKRRY